MWTDVGGLRPPTIFLKPHASTLTSRGARFAKLSLVLDWENRSLNCVTLTNSSRWYVWSHSLPTDQWSLVIDQWPLAIVHWSLAIGHWSLIMVNWPLTTELIHDHWLIGARWTLIAEHRSWTIGRRSMIVDHGSLMTNDRSLIIDHRLLCYGSLIIARWPLVPECQSSIMMNVYY